MRLILVHCFGSFDTAPEPPDVGYLQAYFATGQSFSKVLFHLSRGEFPSC
jgi:hypothetical protein